jgi:RNA polymerase-binding transcription factor DksA
MSSVNESDLELAARMADAERDAGVSRAVAAVAGTGSRICRDCGDEIDAHRRSVAPWAVRCIYCQQEIERRTA